MDEFQCKVTLIGRLLHKHYYRQLCLGSHHLIWMTNLDIHRGPSDVILITDFELAGCGNQSGNI